MRAFYLEIQMLSEERKAELANEFTSMLERYIGKRWLDSDVKDNIAEDEEERAFLRGVSYSVTAHY
jgi:hypothetical protein